MVFRVQNLEVFKPLFFDFSGSSGGASVGRSVVRKHGRVVINAVIVIISGWEIEGRDARHVINVWSVGF